MPITQNQLTEDMVYYLKSFSSSASTVNASTIHETILSDDGFGSATSKRIYKSLVRFSVTQNGSADKTWPTNWMKLSVADLARKLLAGG